MSIEERSHSSRGFGRRRFRKLAWRHNPILLCAGLAALLMVPGASTLLWVLLGYIRKAVWHPGWVLFGAIHLLVGSQVLTLAALSLLTKRAERRVLQEIRTHTLT